MNLYDVYIHNYIDIYLCVCRNQVRVWEMDCRKKICSLQALINRWTGCRSRVFLPERRSTPQNHLGLMDMGNAPFNSQGVVKERATANPGLCFWIVIWIHVGQMEVLEVARSAGGLAKSTMVCFAKISRIGIPS